MVAAQRGVWKSVTLQNMLAARGHRYSAGKMSALWNGKFQTIKPDDLAALCVTLNCEIGELLSFEPAQTVEPGTRLSLGTTTRETQELSE
ncbi:helix-turn-helix domain-containing protein [Saccharopolyspora antimicrobica]|nr:helix-turn-helix transcriptional regulator [Saccharopolyspora antimicrobica]